jgi:5-bromo-4-chloroindolyl phosphate hydrolysis protein
MMSIEAQARWYATKLILVYFSIITVLIVIGSIDLFYLAVAVVVMLALMIASAIYRDAYYDKLWELKRSDQSRTN